MKPRRRGVVGGDALRDDPPEPVTKDDITPVLRAGDPSYDKLIAQFGEGAADHLEEMEWDTDVVAAMIPLSKQQQLFVIYYAWPGAATYGVAARAARAAGVGYSTVSRWLQADAVQGAIKSFEAQTFRRVGLDATWVLREQLRLYEEAADIANAEKRIAAQVGILDRIANHKDVGAKAADKHEHTHTVSFDEINKARGEVLRRRREGGQPGEALEQ